MQNTSRITRIFLANAIALAYADHAHTSDYDAADNTEPVPVFKAVRIEHTGILPGSDSYAIEDENGNAWAHVDIIGCNFLYRIVTG